MSIQHAPESSPPKILQEPGAWPTCKQPSSSWNYAPRFSRSFGKYPQDIHSKFTVVTGPLFTVVLPLQGSKVSEIAPGDNMAEAKRVLDWKKSYQEALAETDYENLMTKICVAESVICSRLREMHHEPTSRDEVTAIHNAVHGLRLLRCELYSRKKRRELDLLWRRTA
jgi:hypothetical protein